MNSTVRSAARVLDMLEYLALRPEGAGLGECVSALMLPKSSTLMLLRTVVARGYVVRDEEGRYRLDGNFREYGFGWGGHRFARLTAIARPIMADLCEELGETVLLGAAAGSAARNLAKHVAEQVIRYDIEPTADIPYYCTAIGRVLAAFADTETREEMLAARPLKKMTPHTITEPEALTRIIDRVRADGHAIVEEEFALGGTAVAVPIFAADGSVVAALDVGCITNRYPAKKEMILSALRAAASQLSHRISNDNAEEALALLD